MKLTLEVHSVGDTLESVAAAYVENGLPSAMLKRIANGLRMANVSTDDKAHAEDLARMLDTLRAEWQALEATWG